ncbi:MAG: response regulator transcription factor [Lachnospiraceae bacterium]|nr:response regulator transcription factor [Lachnospiraceae bacterium]
MSCIYVVEDDKNIREIETFALTNTGYEVEGFELAKDFYQKLEQKCPDLVLLDVMLPDEDGLEVVKKLRARADTKTIPVLMVTAKSTELDKVKGLDLGADDYMTKPFGIMELISRVKALLRRSVPQENRERMLSLGNVVLDREKRVVYVSGEVCELTFKEYELLKLLMSNAGIVTTRDVILDRVWGTDFEGESRTLDMHIKTLRQKLKEAGSMIKTVRNVGYIMSATE